MLHRRPKWERLADGALNHVEMHAEGLGLTTKVCILGASVMSVYMVDISCETGEAMIS